MNKEEILKQIRKFYEMEFHNVKLAETRKIFKDSDIFPVVRDALLRCHGVALFIQQLDIDYEDIKCLYEEYKAKIENFYLTN